MSRWCIFGTSLEGALGVLSLLKLDPLVSFGLARRGRLGRVGLERGLGLRLLDYLSCDRWYNEDGSGYSES